MKVQIVQKWESPRNKYYECYQHPSRFVRWYFWKRLDIALKMSRINTNKIALDVGCWMGYFLPSLSVYSKEVIGLDLWQQTLTGDIWDKRVVGWNPMDIAQELIDAEIGKTNNIRLLRADATDIPLEDQSIDVLFCLDMMEHMTDSMGTLLLEFKRVLRNDGTLVVSLPNERGPALVARQLFSKVVGISRDKYSFNELVRSFFTGKVPIKQEKSLGSHKGYDYHDDIRKINQYFRIHTIKYAPIPLLFDFNPTILLKAFKE